MRQHILTSIAKIRSFQAAAGENSRPHPMFVNQTFTPVIDIAAMRCVDSQTRRRLRLRRETCGNLRVNRSWIRRLRSSMNTMAPEQNDKEHREDEDLPSSPAAAALGGAG